MNAQTELTQLTNICEQLHLFPNCSVACLKVMTCKAHEANDEIHTEFIYKNLSSWYYSLYAISVHHTSWQSAAYPFVSLISVHIFIDLLMRPNTTTDFHYSAHLLVEFKECEQRWWRSLTCKWRRMVMTI